MAVDYFLKAEGIPGESLDARHKDEIDVLGFDRGVSQEGGTRTGSDSAYGKAVWDTKKNAKG